jgi:hypothetical protein
MTPWPVGVVWNAGALASAVRLEETAPGESGSERLASVIAGVMLDVSVWATAGIAVRTSARRYVGKLRRDGRSCCERRVLKKVPRRSDGASGAHCRYERFRGIEYVEV